MDFYFQDSNRASTDFNNNNTIKYFNRCQPQRAGSNHGYLFLCKLCNQNNYILQVQRLINWLAIKLVAECNYKNNLPCS